MKPAIVVVTINSRAGLLAGSAPPLLFKDTEADSYDEQLSRGEDIWEDDMRW